MRKDRVAAANQLSATFMPAEHAQFDAALHAARCLVVALEAPKKAGIPLQLGAKATSMLAISAAKAVEAREAMIAAHAEFAQILPQLNLGEDWGCTGECPTLEADEATTIRAFRPAAAA